VRGALVSVLSTHWLGKPPFDQVLEEPLKPTTNLILLERVKPTGLLEFGSPKRIRLSEIVFRAFAHSLTANPLPKPQFPTMTEFLDSDML